MLLQSSPPSRDVDEATVLQVDHQNCYCKVRTLRGQVLHQVRWLTPFGGSTRAGDRFSPHMGDRVMIEHGLGSPVITGFFSRLQVQDGSTPLMISEGSVAIDTGSYSSGGGLAVQDQNKPKDSVAGDRILSSVGGAMLGLLRGGAVLIRSSRLSEIMLNKYLSLVRVVSGNWEHFTDVCSDVVKNYKGRVYRYTGYTNDFIESKNEQYRLNLYYGDVSVAEAVKTAYNTSSAYPPSTDIIFKEQILSGTTEEIMRRTLATTGNSEVWIKAGDTFTKVTNTGESLVLTFNNQNTITIQGDMIDLVRSDGAEVRMTSSGISATFESSALSLTASSAKLQFESHFATVDASGVQLG